MMEFLALITLNILLLSGFIQSKNHSINTGSKIVKNIAVQKSFEKISEANNQNQVLGSYVISFDAVNKNSPKESDRKNSDNEKVLYVLETEPTETPNPTPTPDNKEVENESETEPAAPGNAEVLMAKINSYRQENGLPSFLFNQTVCDFAAARAQELGSDFSHNGFRQRIDTKTLPYSDYSHIAENIADCSSPEKAFELWRNSSGHNENMLSSASHGCIGNVGRLYTLEIWQP